MKHIKRVKTSVATLLLGPNQIHRIPVVAISFIPPKGMTLASADDEGNIMIPKYEISDIIPVEDNAENTLVEMVFSEKPMAEEDTEDFSPVEYKVTVPIHTVVLAQALSLINESFNIVVLKHSSTPQKDSQAVELDQVVMTINFPSDNEEAYQDIQDKLSALVDAQFVEPLHPAGGSQDVGYYAIPEPLRRSQMAIMPLLSALSQDDAKTLIRIMALEPILDNFHLRNHNQNPDVSIGEYSKVIESMEDTENYVAPEIPEDIEYMSTFEYSILDNMTDAMEDHLKINEPQVRDRSYYKDVTLLVLLTNIKAVYEQSETDDFITNINLVDEESLGESTVPLNRAFMNIIQTNELNDTFAEIEPEKVERTDIELEWAADVKKWQQSPDEYWPENMSQVEAHLRSLDDADVYFDIMKRSYSTSEEFRDLVSEYSLGKVFTSLILKTAINLSKYTSIVHKHDTETPSTLIATHWINRPDDDYIWEFPALSYDLASYDVSTFVTLLKYIRNDSAGYMSVALHGVAKKIIEEGWDRTNLEWHLSEYTGMPEKYQKMLLDFTSSIDDVEIDPQEIDIHNIESREELDYYVASKGIREYIGSEPFAIDENAHMLAYAFPALADIHVQTLSSENSEDEEQKIAMGSTEWKKNRVQYIEDLLGSVVHNVERKAI